MLAYCPPGRSPRFAASRVALTLPTLTDTTSATISSTNSGTTSLELVTVLTPGFSATSSTPRTSPSFAGFWTNPFQSRPVDESHDQSHHQSGDRFHHHRDDDHRRSSPAQK